MQIVAKQRNELQRLEHCLDASLYKAHSLVFVDNSETFIGFVRENLSTHLHPFNGDNPHSVVVLDNCSIHHTTESLTELQQYGSLIHFLPPYSPDYNPIENIFAKVKRSIKLLEAFDSCTDIESIILQGFATITQDDCTNAILSLGIYKE